jgi:hypothetical protein
MHIEVEDCASVESLMREAVMWLDEGIEKRTMTLRGIVVPVDWDANGLVQTVAILTPDEGEYEVLPSGAGARLATHPRCEVLARAVVPGPGDSPRRVQITSFAVLDWEDSDERDVPV